MSIHRELALLFKAGLMPYEALATGTRNVVAYLGMLASSGAIAIGKRVDLVLLEQNPLGDIRSATTVAGITKGGR